MPKHFDDGQRITIVAGASLGSGETIDLQGVADGLVVDADADTTISSNTDDQIEFQIGGNVDFEMVADTFIAMSGSAINTDTIHETTSANGVDIDGLKVKDATLQAWKSNVIAKTADFNVSASESGCTYEIGAADKVATLPATAPGLRFRFVLATAALSAGTGFSVSPNASDAIMGNGFTTADNKDAICAGSGDRVGDSIEVEGDAAGVGWFIRSVLGTWTRET